MKNNSMYAFDKVAGFTLLLFTGICIGATLATDAWWQLFWAGICATLSLALFADARKEVGK